MSDYTTQLRFICESYANRRESATSSDVDEIIELARPKIFDFSYPIFDDNYKSELEKKIIEHFYTQEIGLETVGLWKLKLRTKMREIMPFYNQLYKSELLEFNPFINTDYQDTRHTEGSDTKDSVSNMSGTSKVETDNVTDTTVNSNGSFTENSEGSKTGQITVSGSDSHDKTGTETTRKTGTDTTKYTPNASKETLVESSDTPLGSVGNLDAGYLTNVTKTTESFNGNKHDDTEVTHNTTDTLTHDVNDAGTHSETTNTVESTEDEKTGSNTNAEAVHTVFDGEVNSTNSQQSVVNDEGTNQSDYAGRLFGKTGVETYSEMLQKFRDTFLNIDMQVIHELDELFMQIW